MIEIIPAIDLMDGKCVRLTQGKFSSATYYSADPLQTALSFQEAGLTRLHLVDLDGARTGKIVNSEILEKLCAKTRLKIDFGGGLRSTAAVRKAFALGAAQVSCGSIAITNPELFEGWLDEFGPEHVVLAADFKAGRVVSHGWTKSSEVELHDYLADQYANGLQFALCTDVSKDGAMLGPAFETYQSLCEDLPGLKIIASGGVSSAADIERLAELGVSGVIVGKALYEGVLTMSQLSQLQERYAH